MKRPLLLFLLLTVVQLPLHSQSVELPLFTNVKNDFYYQAQLNGDSIILGYAPIFQEDLKNDSLVPYAHVNDSRRGSWFGRKLFRENFIILDQKDIYLTLDPIFNFTGGQERLDDQVVNLYQNTRGIRIQAELGQKFVLETAFLENQARLPSYVSEFVANNGVVPGMGRVKVFKQDEVDYSMSTASIAWKINKQIRVKLGYGKNHLGLGYRSVLLSDNSFVYPHLRIDLHSKNQKWHYTLNYALLQNLERLPDGETPESLFERKYAAFHYFAFTPNHKWEFGIFSGTVFNTEGDQFWDIINPIPLVNPLANADKYISRVGLHAHYFPFPKMRIYGQVAYQSKDEINSIYQVGLHFSRLLNWVDIGLEYSSEAQSATNTVASSYSHYEQSLAHTLGSGFDELNLQLLIGPKRLLLRSGLSLGTRNTVDMLKWGFESLPGSSIAEASSMISSSELIYMFNPKTQMNVALGYLYRDVEGQAKTNYIYLSFRTSIFNEYRDF